MRTRIIAPLLLAALVLTQLATAAELGGTLYTQDLDVARYSLLLVESSPPQRIILPNGTYSITLSPGIYTVRAYYSDRAGSYEDSTTLNITHEGVFTYDFILFPTDANLTEQLPDIDDISITDAESDNTVVWTTLLAALAIIILIIAIITLRRRPRAAQRPSAESPEKTADTPAPPRAEELAADLRSIITALKAEGGRMTQKELRKLIPCSEAKMSMMLTELEHKKRIERIKKGRGNLIVLKK